MNIEKKKIIKNQREIINENKRKKNKLDEKEDKRGKKDIFQEI